MGIKSVMNTDRLFWLGRYSERVYTTLRLFSLSFDSLIEQSVDDHRAFCESLEIPDIYRDKDDFIDRYAFGLDDPNSIISNLYRAYDNAIELREEIGSETLSFIQMAIYEMKSAKRSEAPMLHFQKITDAILAFWGCADDQIDDIRPKLNVHFVGDGVSTSLVGGRCPHRPVDFTIVSRADNIRPYNGLMLQSFF